MKKIILGLVSVALPIFVLAQDNTELKRNMINSATAAIGGVITYKEVKKLNRVNTPTKLKQVLFREIADVADKAPKYHFARYDAVRNVFVFEVLEEKAGKRIIHNGTEVIATSFSAVAKQNLRKSFRSSYGYIAFGLSAMIPEFILLTQSTRDYMQRVLSDNRDSNSGRKLASGGEAVKTGEVQY